MKVIAKIKSDFPGKFGIPRQSGLIEELRATIIFEEEFRVDEALRGIEDFSHLWLIWEFSENKRDTWSPTVRPPRLGGNKRVGVFATRSSFRPNSIGLSSVKLLGVEKTKEYGTVLHIAGADLMDGTPIYDIKPYLSFTDSHPEASGGFADEKLSYSLKVEMSEKVKKAIPEDEFSPIVKILESDPRPSYIEDEERVYAFEYAGMHLEFTVSGDTLTLLSVNNITTKKED
ncbi:MAG: tRNA (N6-threonylcarbamoyladenosine(37)-N6)-methyltransferase TrmO [Clostridia bacterium]|nr:tRNA (N6-threonylcarbamoyladenosine(37)-N6)-methyltransferase TrmO [Clostridia bacterium]